MGMRHQHTADLIGAPDDPAARVALSWWNEDHVLPNGQPAGVVFLDADLIPVTDPAGPRYDPKTHQFEIVGSYGSNNYQFEFHPDNAVLDVWDGTAEGQLNIGPTDVHLYRNSPTGSTQMDLRAGSDTGSGTGSIGLYLTDNWNTPSTPCIALLVAATGASVPAGSLLADFRYGGASQFSIGLDGAVVVPALPVNGVVFVDGNTGALATDASGLQWDRQAKKLAMSGQTTANAYIFHVWPTEIVLDIADFNTGRGARVNVDPGTFYLFHDHGDGSRTQLDFGLGTDQSLTLTEDWGISGVAHTAFTIEASVTTPLVAGSLLADFRFNSASQFAVHPTGALLLAAVTSPPAPPAGHMMLRARNIFDTVGFAGLGMTDEVGGLMQMGSYALDSCYFGLNAPTGSGSFNIQQIGTSVCIFSTTAPLTMKAGGTDVAIFRPDGSVTFPKAEFQGDGTFVLQPNGTRKFAVRPTGTLEMFALDPPDYGGGAVGQSRILLQAVDLFGVADSAGLKISDERGGTFYVGAYYAGEEEAGLQLKSALGLTFQINVANDHTTVASDRRIHFFPGGASIPALLLEADGSVQMKAIADGAVNAIFANDGNAMLPRLPTASPGAGGFLWRDQQPTGLLATASRSSDLAITGANESQAQAIVTLPPVLCDTQHDLVIRFQAPSVLIGAGCTLRFILRNSSGGVYATIGRVQGLNQTTGLPITLTYVMPAMTGTYTFEVAAWQTGGTATIQGGNGGASEALGPISMSLSRVQSPSPTSDPVRITR
jgi:hypothetical protein